MRIEEGGDVVEAKLKANFLIREVMNVVHESTRFSGQSRRKLQEKPLKVREPMTLIEFGIPANMAKLSFQSRNREICTEICRPKEILPNSI
jgi:hypothetical protein